MNNNVNVVFDAEDGDPTPFGSVGGGQSTGDGGIDFGFSRKLPKLSTATTTLQIEGLEVHFPFTPYNVQFNYMAGVIRSLSSGEHGLLESPTGTGKTLCLLCASLAWLVNERKQNPLNPPKILYTSRTHAQLAQVVREFQRTVYSEECSMAILGSREHMCIKKEVRDLPSAHARNSTCNRLRQERECGYGNGVPEYIRQQEKTYGIGGVTPLLDIEDLVKEGRKAKFCPYFYEREMAKTADIVFLPYSYVMDRSLTAQLMELVQKERLILIIDEAHNIPSNLGSSASVNLSAVDLSNAINEASLACSKAEMELKEEGDLNRRAELEGFSEMFSILKIVLVNLEREIAAHPGIDTNKKEAVHPGSHMFTLLDTENVRINAETYAEHQKNITNAVAYLAGTDTGGRGLAQVQAFLTMVFDTGLAVEEIDIIYRFVLQSVQAKIRAQFVAGGRKGGDVTTERRTLGFWCLDTAVAMRKVAEPYSVILMTSGTLSPLDHFAAELGLHFGVMHQGRHVVKNSQLFGSVLCKGPASTALNSSYEFRSSEEYRTQLGLSIVNIARNVPGGMLVFFPSYASMNLAIDLWKSGSRSSAASGDGSTVWGMLSGVKSIFVEPTDGSELPKMVQEYQRSCDQRHGAILLAVARGKIGEGVDFADRHGRCVFVTGIPFANNSDLAVRLKREYLTQVAPTRPKVRGKLFTGDDWYRNEAMRAVNQCVGRVIRHKDDYGAVILGDERFVNQRDAVSPWIQAVMQTHNHFRDTYSGVTKFFIDIEKANDELKPKRPRGGEGDATAASSAGAAAFMANASAFGVAPQTADAARKFHAERVAATTAGSERDGGDALTSDPAEPSLVAVGQAQSREDGREKRVTLQSDASLVFTKGTLSNRLQQQPQKVKPVGVPVAKPSPAVPPAGAPSADDANRNASKNFIEGLKQVLPADSYKQFKEILGGIAKLAQQSNCTPEQVKQQLKTLIAQLHGVFSVGFGGDAAKVKAAMVEFGCYIPVAWRPYYARMIR